MRTSEMTRDTNETKIKMKLTLDTPENGRLIGSSGIGFFDHMLNSFCVHGGLTLELECSGDLEVDCHHTVEDIGIVLGLLFSDVLSERRGIKRFSDITLPMDESLVLCAIDISGRPFLTYDVPVSMPLVGSYDTQMTKEFFRALTFNMGATLHIKLLYGENTHHIIEAVFKAAARAVSDATRIVGDWIPSAKGNI